MSNCTTLIVSQSNQKKRKKEKKVMNNLSPNLYQDMLNNELKRRLFSKSKLRGWKQHITIRTHVIKHKIILKIMSKHI